MRTSATGRSSKLTAPRAPVMAPRRARGFTLLELLVVMVIIAVMTGFAVLSVGWERHEQARQEARRVRAVFDLAAQEAVLRGREIGVQFSGHGYRFLDVGSDGKWFAADGKDELFRERSFDQDVELGLVSEGVTYDLSREDEDKAMPHILFLSSGEMSHFELTFRQEAQHVVLTGYPSGMFELKEFTRDEWY